MAARGNSFSAVKRARTYSPAALEFANRLCGRLYCLREIRRLLAATAEISLRQHLVRLFVVCGLRTQELFVLPVGDVEAGILRVDQPGVGKGTPRVAPDARGRDADICKVEDPATRKQETLPAQ
jgi:hypothetical protein